MSGQQHLFPRMQTSPGASPSHSPYRSPGHSSHHRSPGHRSPAHSTQPLGRTRSANAHSCWASMRRDRQARVDAVLDAHAANVAAGLPSPPQRLGEGTRNAASAQDVVKAVRSRAREVGWMLGKRTKPKTTRLTELANALRSTAYDEDDVISDGLHAGSQAAGGMAEQSAEFETVQEIAALRALMRSLVRLQAEHPDPDVRRSTGELLTRLNGGEKKALNMPVPRAVASGPSFFFPSYAFVPRVAHDHSGYAYDAGDSSSDEEYSDCSDDNSQPQARGTHWARAFAEALEAQWQLGPPHIFQLLQAQPQCGYALAATFGSVFRVQRSTVKERDAHCLFAAAAAQVGCYPLVCLAEDRALAACDVDDADACEQWLTHGLVAASAKTKLLAQFGARLCERPWHLAADDVARYVDEYVRIHAAQVASAQAHTALAQPRRSLSSSVVAAGLSRKSIEESALRDLLHAIVVMAVAHGLGAFASACGVVPDLDLPAGSFFPHPAAFMAAETIPGLPHVLPAQMLPPVFSAQPAPLLPTFVDQVEKNTADMIARLQQPLYPEPARPDYAMSPCMPWLQHSLPPPPISVLRRLSGGPESRTAAYVRSLAHVVDPLTSSAQHFDSYRHMRARKLAKYDLPLSPQTATAVHLTAREDLRWDALSSYLRQQLSIDDDYLGKETQAARGVTARPFADAVMSSNSPQSDNSDAAVFVADLCAAPLKSEATKHEWDRAPEYIECEPADDLKPKCYSMSSVFSIPRSNAERNMYQSTASTAGPSPAAAPSQVVNARQFHDAIWHFTLSLYHIYEEDYFYSKFKDEMTPESTQPAAADTHFPQQDTGYSQYGAMPIPSPHPNHQGLASAGMSVDTDMDIDIDMSNSSSQYHFSSCSPLQYSKWLTEELKLHIRSVVRNPASIHAMAAQPPIATGLNLCIEEMVHVNLVISLAKRQAEIIHGIRAIQEYEENPSRF
ncbi:hypothetical protein GGI20_003538 [Coemansia sp. BCRC 34301]|nr:hypothetical protein GGI20_003538 [Coemansia sp. BCRC 34301]